MSYVKQTWADGQAGGTPITAATLGHVEDGIAAEESARIAGDAASQPLDADLSTIGALNSAAVGVIASDGAGWVSKNVAAFKTWLGLAKADVGLGNVDNTADASKPVSTAQQTALNLKLDVTAAAGAYQPVDSDLTAIAALTTAAYGRALLALADAAALRTAAGLGTASTSASTDFQPVDSDLTAIAALTTTSFGRSFLDRADAAAGRTLLGLATVAATGAYSDLTGKPVTSWTIQAKTAAYTATDGDLVLADATSGAFTVTLPASTAGRKIAVRKIDSGTNAITVATTSGTIDGAATRTLPVQWQTQVYVADGTNWQRLDVPGVTAIAATGTPSSTTYLRGDGAWATPAGGSGQVTTSANGSHTGLWYATPSAAAGFNQIAPAVGTMHAVPLVLPACTLQALAVRVITTAAGSLIRLGIYADDGTGYPGALILDAGQVSGATGGVISATISQSVSGLIWLASVNQTGTPSCQSQADMYYGLGVANANVLHVLAGDVKYAGYSMTGVTGALPGTFSTTVTEVSAAIRVAARVA